MSTRNILFWLLALTVAPVPVLPCVIVNPIWQEIPETSVFAIPGKIVPRVVVVSQPKRKDIRWNCGDPGSVEIYLEFGALHNKPKVLTGFLIEHIEGKIPLYLEAAINKVVTMHSSYVRIPMPAAGNFDKAAFDITIRLTAIDIHGRRSESSEPFRIFRPQSFDSYVAYYNKPEKVFSNRTEVMESAKRLISYVLDARFTSQFEDMEASDLLNLSQFTEDVFRIRHETIYKHQLELEEALKIHYQIEDTEVPLRLISPSYSKLYALVMEAHSLFFFSELRVKIGISDNLDRIVNKGKRALFSTSRPDEYAKELIVALALIDSELESTN